MNLVEHYKIEKERKEVLLSALMRLLHSYEFSAIDNPKAYENIRNGFEKLNSEQLDDLYTIIMFRILEE